MFKRHDEGERKTVERSVFINTYLIIDGPAGNPTKSLLQLISLEKVWLFSTSTS